MNTFIRSVATLALVAASASSALAQDVTQGPIRIGQPVARATVPGQPAGGGYLKLENTGKTPDRLLSVKSDVAASTELHSMSMEGDIMRMREVDAIDLPPGKTVELKPGGLHIMFIGLKAPLKAGDKFPATLTFEKAGAVQVTVSVQPVTAAPAHQHHGDHKH